MYLIGKTRAHYEEYPFIEGGRKRIAHWDSRIRRTLPDSLVCGSLVLDVGCGSGEVACGLAGRGARVACLDLTEAAVRRIQELGGGLGACQGDALRLPFQDGVFDHAISIGVLHHTPDTFQGLTEMIRVTRPGGRVVVLLYSRWTPYHLAYVFTGPLRAGPQVKDIPRRMIRPSRPIVRFLIHQRLDDIQIRRLIADQFWTPQASFHTPREMRRWAPRLGASIVRRRCIPGYASLFVLERRAASRK